MSLIENAQQLEKRFWDRLGKEAEMPGRSVAALKQHWANRAAREATVDYLGEIELGCLISALPSPLEDGSARILDSLASLVLDDDAARTHPRFRLALLLAARLDGRWGHEDVGYDDESFGLYSQFLALALVLHRDADATSFIYVLKTALDTSSEHTPWKRLTSVMAGRREGIVEAVVGISPDKNVGKYLNGFARYLQHLLSVEQILRRADKYPLFQSALWHYHADVLGEPSLVQRLSYWFTEFDNHLRATGVDIEYLMPDIAGVPGSWSQPLLQQLGRLQLGKYERPIASAVAAL